ncbi:peptidyl-alpha-hydroxyglycine alpha-amidating lyase family protein [Chloroflexota bacterium]
MLYGNDEYGYELVENWAKLPEGWNFLDVGGIGVDPEDNIYVFNRSSHPMIVFDSDGNFLRSWGEDFFSRPHGTRFSDDGFVYCTDDGNHTVTKFTPEGELLMTMGTKDKPSDTGYIEKADLAEAIDTIVRGGGPFNRPTGIDLSSNGEIYVCDGYGNARIHRFTPEGELISSWGGPGTGQSEFRLPHNIWVDKQDRVWVPDRENSRIQIFDAEGKFLTQWDQVVRPADVFIDDDDVVYVPEIGHVGDAGPKISLFTLDGKLLSYWGCEGVDHESELFVSPHALTVDSKGAVYVGEVAKTHSGLDRGSRVIQKFARKR